MCQPLAEIHDVILVEIRMPLQLFPVLLDRFAQCCKLSRASGEVGRRGEAIENQLMVFPAQDAIRVSVE